MGHGNRPRNGQVYRDELERVLSSACFARSERVSKLLRFLVEWQLDGRENELKESVIGVEVFGRSPDYNPKLDSTVRTEAVRLRARLDRYYAIEGSRAPLVIELPKGGYVPPSGVRTLLPDSARQDRGLRLIKLRNRCAARTGRRHNLPIQRTRVDRT